MPTDATNTDVLSPESEIIVETMTETPESLRGTNRERNMIAYDDNRIHLARMNGEIYGAIRSALRDDPQRRHGFIGDLQVEENNRGEGLEELLIRAAEKRLFEEECTRIDAVMKDGEGWTRHYAERGFWTSRKTVDLAWDLDELTPVDVPEVSGATISKVRSFDVEKMTDFIVDSYQPYWRFWKEYKEDVRWVRVEYGEDDNPPESEELRVEMRARVREKLETFNAENDQVFFVARQDGEIIAACDALDSPDGDTFEWGMLAVYDYGIKNLGSALVGHALNWLTDRNHEYARIKTTSGLDDYDPTVYLYTASTGGRIVGEYVNCTKLRTGEQPNDDVPDATF